MTCSWSRKDRFLSLLRLPLKNGGNLVLTHFLHEKQTIAPFSCFLSFLTKMTNLSSSFIASSTASLFVPAHLEKRPTSECAYLC